MSKYFSIFVAVLIGNFCSGRAATAADLQKLAEFVRPAYTAMNFAAVCVRDNPSFLTDVKGPRGTAFHYAQHVKDEAIEGLSPADAATVLKSAADAARETARAKLHGSPAPATR